MLFRSQLAEVGGGWVVPASVEGLEKGMIDVLPHPELVVRAALNIKQYVAEYFSWNIIIQTYKNLYTQLTATSAGKK